jgi:hypothetical protein
LNIGSFRLCDADCFFEDGRKVTALLAALGTNDVFPYHVSWSNKLTCPSGLSVMFSHLPDNSDLFHEKARPRTGKARAFSGNRQILSNKVNHRLCSQPVRFPRR